MRRGLLSILIVAGTLFIATVCYSAIFITDRGEWPSTWPKELDQYRKQAKTIGVAHGIQETVYEIRFNSRDEFEKAWPHILKLKSPGAPLILERSPSNHNRSGTKAEAGVRILCPPGGTLRFPDGTELRADAPWPESATLPGGGLPEYVVVQDGKWVPFDGKERTYIQHRARIDIMLITDGQIVDLNSTPLPENTPIIDRRFPKAEQAWGKPVEGIQVRLTPDKRLWKEGEEPSFKVDVRNSGARKLLTSSICSLVLEVDGKAFGPKAWSRTGLIERKPFGPGAEHSYAVSLGQFGPFRWSKEQDQGGEALPPGKHTIRAALLDNVRENAINTSLTGYPETALAFSDVVEIEIIAKPKDNVANQSGAPNQSVEDVAANVRQVLRPNARQLRSVESIDNPRRRL